MTRICVFGASRGTGAEVVNCARRNGMRVTAAFRNPGSLIDRDGVSMVRSDVYDLESIREAIRGAEAVISTIGPTRRSPQTTIYSEGVMNIARTMRDAGTPRLIVVDGLGANPNPDLNWHYAFAMKFIVRPFFGFAYRDAARMEQQLAGVDLDWTVVRVPWLSDRAQRGVRSAIASPIHHGTKLGRHDLAAYLVSIINDSRTFRTWTEVAW